MRAGCLAISTQRKRVLMTKTILLAQVAEEVPWSDDSTEYDNQHDKTYIRLLDANKERVSKDEMARLIWLR